MARTVSPSKQALHYLVLVNETLDATWLTNRSFRVGASSLLDDLVRQWKKETRGRYIGVDDVAIG